jgi:hypothetical protein
MWQKKPIICRKIFCEWKTGNYVPVIPVEPENKRKRFFPFKGWDNPPYLKHE